MSCRPGLGGRFGRVSRYRLSIPAKNQLRACSGFEAAVSLRHQPFAQTPTSINILFILKNPVNPVHSYIHRQAGHVGVRSSPQRSETAWGRLIDRIYRMNRIFIICASDTPRTEFRSAIQLGQLLSSQFQQNDFRVCSGYEVAVSLRAQPFAQTPISINILCILKNPVNPVHSCIH